MTIEFVRNLATRMSRRVRSGRPHPPPRDVELQERRVYEAFLRPGHVVFDVGANIGDMTELFAAAIGPTGMVVAFEPTASTFIQLKERFSRLSFGNVELVDAAVTDEEGTVDLHVYEDDHHSWSSLAVRPLERYGIHITPPHVEAVRSVTVDGYCAARGIGHIDLLKVDVEGAELLVLRGARRMLENRQISLVVFEFGQTTFDMGFSAVDLRELFADVRYHVRNVIDDESPFPGGTSAEAAVYSMHVAAPSGES